MALKPDPGILPAAQRRTWDALAGESRLLRKHGYYLAGGTALALQIGHRRSVDFDFFSTRGRTGVWVRRRLEALPGTVLRDADKDTVHAELRGVKVSFIGAYAYPLVGPLANADGIQLASVLDIGLMKLLTITHRATLRDYVDLAAIIRDHISLPELLDRCRRKYGRAFNPMISLKSLVWFDDLDPDMPVMFDKGLSRFWKQILRQAVRSVG